MFPAGNTPYGPPAANAFNPPAAQPYLAAPQQPRAQQQPLAQQWPVAPPVRRKNGFGVASVWVASFAFLLSFAGLQLSFIFIALAAIFGFVGVSRGRSVNLPTLAAAVGLGITAFAFVIGLMVTVTRYY